MEKKRKGGKNNVLKEEDLTRSNMSLYRKYRPKDFTTLVGQEHIRKTLLSAAKHGQIAHAYLFTGPRGTGKTTTARLMAKAINAEMTEDGRFDGSEIAEEIDAGKLIDVIEIDAASNRGIDEIRDLREKISYSPTRAKNKVYIIDEVHMLTKEAFNALLKTLEEPPAFVYFILATTEIHKVPETIISRCQRFDFRRITDDDLLARLKVVCKLEEIEAEDKALTLIAKQARGGLRDALSMLEQMISSGKLDLATVQKNLGISDSGAAAELYQLIINKEATSAIEKLAEIYKSGFDLIQFCKELLDYLREKMLEAVKNGKNAEAYQVVSLIQNFQEAYEKIKFAYIPELPIEMAIVKSCLADSMEIRDAGEGSKKKPELIISTVKVAQSNVANISVETKTVESAENSAKVDDNKVTNAEVIENISVQNNGSVSSVDLQTVKQKWQDILNKIDNSLAKRCLANAFLLGVDHGNLHLGFSSNFNKDKLFVPELVQICEQALEAVLGVSLKLVGEVKLDLASQSISFAPSTPIDNSRSHQSIAPAQTSPTPAVAPVEVQQKSAENVSALDAALNVFGGSVVE